MEVNTPTQICLRIYSQTQIPSLSYKQIVCANENAQLMQAYAASTNALVTDKLTAILKDWAKAKAAYYDMDNKIAQVIVHCFFYIFLLNGSC